MSSNISPDISIFIISWMGQHENAAVIANQLNDIKDQVSIIYSDPDPEYSLKVSCKSIKRSNELFFGDKFKACLDNCAGENLLLIHADCKCNNWINLIKKYDKAIKQLGNLGVWSPLVDFTKLDLKAVSLLSINNSYYEVCCQIDGQVLGLSKAIQNRMKLADYQFNIYGWGIGRMIACFALSINQLLIVDKSIQVEYPKTKGYCEPDARDQRDLFLRQLTVSEKIFSELIHSHMMILRVPNEIK